MRISPEAWNWEAAHGRCLREARRHTRSEADAQDAAQEAMLQAWRSRDSCRTPEDPIPWMLAITRREAWRTRPAAVAADVDASPWAQRASFDDDERVVERLDIRAAIAVLTARERQLLHLRYAEDLAQPSVAQRLGIPEGTAKVGPPSRSQPAARPPLTSVTPTKNPSKPRGRDEAADANLVKALSHPLRWQILRMINEGTSTPAGIARRLGVRTENVSYHVRVLSELGVIELVGTTPVRGALEHHYRATRRAEVSDADSEAMPDEVRRDMVQGIVRLVIEDLVRIGASEQSYERADVHFSQVPLRLDEQGFTEVADLLASTLDRVMEIQAESLSRLSEDDSDEVRTEVAIMHFPFVPPEV